MLRLSLREGLAAEFALRRLEDPMTVSGIGKV